MMGSLLRIVFFSLLLLGLAWGLLWAGKRPQGPALLEDERRLREAFHRPPWSRESGAGGAALPFGLELPFPGGREDASLASRLLQRRALLAWGLLPFLGLSFGIAILAGLLWRERLRGGTAYASPTLSFLSKRVAEAALVLFVLGIFAPLGGGYGGLYVLIFLFMLGVTGYVGNLPLRL